MKKTKDKQVLFFRIYLKMDDGNRILLCAANNTLGAGIIMGCHDRIKNKRPLTGTETYFGGNLDELSLYL